MTVDIPVIVACGILTSPKEEIKSRVLAALLRRGAATRAKYRLSTSHSSPFSFSSPPLSRELSSLALVTGYKFTLVWIEDYQSHHLKAPITHSFHIFQK